MIKDREAVEETEQQEQRYFTRKERNETLRKNVRIGRVKIQKRPAYTYKCSGAVYIGEWIGGMRHGMGMMQWPDGA